MTTQPRIAVLGANGHTGRFVVEALNRKGAIALPATRSGRFVDRSGVAARCSSIDFSRSDSLDAALADANAVINCAGPFFDTAEPAAEAAIRATIPYLDVAAEQMTVLRVFERLHDRASRAGVPLLPAMAFYGGLADLLVSALVGDPANVESIDIAVGLDSWHPTNGTRLTGEQNIFEKLIVRNGALAPVPAPPPSRDWDFPAPFDVQPVTCVVLSEIILLSRHIKAQGIISYMNLKPLADLQDQETPPPKGEDDSGRSGQKFVIDVRAQSEGRVLRATASGRDIYAVTAPLIVNACLEFLTNGWSKSGARAPGELFEPRKFLRALEPDISVRYADTRTDQHAPVF